MNVEQEHKKIAGIRTAALVEIAIFFAAMLALDFALFGGGRFVSVEPHPYWVIVLLVACQYGTAEGLVAAVAATAALLLFNLPEQTLRMSMYDYLFHIAKLPLLWLVTAVALGELRGRHVRERSRLTRALAESREREEHITRQYQWTRELKDRLELKVAGQLRSSAAAYRAAQQMDSLDQGGVLRGMEELVGTLMNPEKFSLWQRRGDDFTLALSHGWNAHEYADVVTARSDLGQAMMLRRMLVVAKPEDERMLAGQGQLAGPLVDKDTGEVLGMLKIEKLGFAGLNLSGIETFTALCEWASLALVNARRYEAVREEGMVNPDHRLHTRRYFDRYREFIASLAKRVGFSVSMLTLRLEGADDVTPEVRTDIARQLADAVDAVLRAVDLAFDYSGGGAEYSVVLPATDRKGAEVVANKVRAQIQGRLRGNLRLSFSIQALQEK